MNPCAGCGKPAEEHQGVERITYRDTAGNVIDSHVVPPAGLVYSTGTYYRPCKP